MSQRATRAIRGVVPQISVVLCTYNRAGRVVDAAGAILDQQGADLELLVVDDGSTDATPEVLAAIDDPRLRVVRRRNGGLSAARNTGLAAVTAPWVTFIDDDDRALPGWLAAFVRLGADDGVGIACCGSEFVDPDGRFLFPSPPVVQGLPLGDDIVASTLAGTFAVRVDLARRAGGYLDGLGTRHQTELFQRLVTLARADGLRVASVPDLLVRIEARPATERPGVNPRRLYDGTRWIIARHPQAYTGRGRHVALFEGVAGTNAARLGDWRAARRRFRRSVVAQPSSREAWGRLALATVPPLATLFWNRHGDWATHDATEVGVRRQVADGDQTSAGAVDPAGRELFLTWRYQENASAPADGSAPVGPSHTGELGGAVGSSDTRPHPARRLAVSVARRRGITEVVDLSGPDEGDAVDRPVGVTAGTDGEPRLVVADDLLHRVDDPVALLRRARAAAGPGGLVLITTPDRAVIDPDRPLGPPADPGHRRQWSLDQLELLLLSCGLDTVRWWHLADLPAAVDALPDWWAARAAIVPRPGVRRSTLAVLAAPRPEAPG